MKLLVLTNNPSRPSFRQRIKIHLETIEQAGVSYEVVKFPSEELARFRLFRKAADFDGVLLHKKCLNCFDAYFLRRYSRKIIYDLDDAVMYSPESPESNKTSHFRLFRRTAGLADMIIAGNSYLAEHAKRFNNNVHILPTGLDTKAYNLSVKPKNDGKIRLVWIGSKNTLKYLEELKPALEEVGAKYPNIVLRIICDDFFDLENMEVEKYQWSLAGQARDLATSHIGLAPLPSNRFTRGKCGFKALQYSAAGLPVIASPVGVNSEYVINRITGYHAFRHQQWVDRICECVESESLRKEMGNTGKELIKTFDTNLIGNKLCALITDYLKYNTITIDTNAIPIVATIPRSKPNVSICIPTYNRREYLRETLVSIFAQTYKNYEVVIVDDGSTDGTEEMIKDAGYDVRYYWVSHIGQYAVRNKLIELAQGEHITFLDSDDLLFPDTIERLIKALETNGPNTIAYGSYVGIDEKGKYVKRKQRCLPSGNIAAELFEFIYVHSCGMMCAKTLFKEVGGFDTSLKCCAFYKLLLKLSVKYKFIMVQGPTFKRRRHKGNVSNRSLLGCKTELEVLEDFYLNGGGKEIVPQCRAMKRLSQEGYRAGRCAIREGMYDQARQLLSQSFRRYPNIKSLIHWTRTMLKSR